MPYARFERPAQDAAGNLLPDIWCEVRREEVAGNPLEPLFADRLGAVPLENPFFTPSGIPAFHAAGGAYRVRYYKAGFDETYRYQAVGVGAENDLQGFIPMGSWDAETSYLIGDVVTHPDGLGTLHLFASKVNDNIGEEPVTTPAPEESGFWAYIGLAIPGPRGEGLRFDAQVNLLSGRDAYDDAVEGFALLVSNIGDGRAAIYVMGDGGSADWSAPSYVTPTAPFGTTAGTYVEGNDSRVVNAVQNTDTRVVDALVKNVEDQGPLTGGARVTPKNLGNLSGASITPDPGDRSIQKITNNGAGSILPGSNEGQYTLQVINASGAGAITTTGWTLRGDAFDTTTTSKFLCSCIVTSDIKLMTILKVA